MEVMHGAGMKPYSDQFEEYPEEIQKLYFELSEIAQRLRNEFGGAVIFDAVDTVSPLGIWKTIRHRILRTPCVLIEGKKVFGHFPNYDELRSKVTELMGQTGMWHPDNAH